ncbi:unnamed protein product (macronuclear) [Paramecium tetraurelia]|uniref:UBC core domain-containing protein n=1 Tax=Paramecium tetraurelia TaxID=5888 RepID=A0CVS4_PARTE|nr:uncharacterized protein GSPATT00039052001 [Paramecium tetraurelia]CAK74891.1 unnamed protein product [Paramecium tetraurelia]|eukprot:XP_001442288.1 hypothetical protein (macronuclear) [Paramecium tetraurelia strain d4-2]
MAKERIRRDFEQINKMKHQGTDDFIVDIYEIGNYQIQICIKGPDDSPYKNYLFFLNFQFSIEYPQIPPQVTFMNKIFHPNINVLGYIYLGILKDDWTSDYTVHKILTSIKQLLKNPDEDNSFFPDATLLYKNNKIDFEKKAKEWAQKYAIYN